MVAFPFVGNVHVGAEQFAYAVLFEMAALLSAQLKDLIHTLASPRLNIIVFWVDLVLEATR
jgi:hypothetical protein